MEELLHNMYVVSVFAGLYRILHPRLAGLEIHQLYLSEKKIPWEKAPSLIQSDPWPRLTVWMIWKSEIWSRSSCVREIREIWIQMGMWCWVDMCRLGVWSQEEKTYWKWTWNKWKVCKILILIVCSAMLVEGSLYTYINFTSIVCLISTQWVI